MILEYKIKIKKNNSWRPQRQNLWNQSALQSQSLNRHCEITDPRFNSKWERSHHTYLLGKLHGSQHQRNVECWGPPGFCSLDQLPAHVPWTYYCLRLTPVSHHRVDFTKPLVLFYSLTERVTETRHVLFCMESRSATQRQLHWFLMNMILSLFPLTLPFPSPLFWSLIMPCMMVFDFWGFK